MAEERKTAPEIVQQILHARKLKVHEGSDETKNKTSLFTWLDGLVLGKFEARFGYREATAKFLPKKEIAVEMLDKLELESPGLTKYEDSNGEIHDRDIRDQYKKRMENFRTRKIQKLLSNQGM